LAGLLQINAYAELRRGFPVLDATNRKGLRVATGPSTVSTNIPQFELGRRSVLIDFLRGLCLVLMTIDHLPLSLIKKFTWQTFGFFSAAECFVFLSGLVAGRVYGRTALTRGIAAVRQRALRRALTLYFTNAVLVTLAILAANAGLTTLGKGLYPSWSLWVRTMLFIASPSYSEILRMYCIFLLSLPAVLWALVNHRFYYVVVISGGTWLAASQGYGMAALPGSGYFDVMSWQLLFVAGIYFGFAGVRKSGDLGEREELHTPALWTSACLAVVVTFFVARHWYSLTGEQLSPYLQWLWSWRRTLTLGRLLDFAAFSILVYRFRAVLLNLIKTLPGRAITFLGQHSLQVFVWSISVTMLVSESEERWIAPAAPDHPLVCTALVLASCFIPAWLHAQWQALRHGMSDLPEASAVR
jgi:hypothetical protein